MDQNPKSKEMSQLFEKIPMEGVKNIIVVASGKGGVGKSTVAANLAVSMSGNGYKIALVDTDIYGPSIPRMFGIEDAKPDVTAFGDKEMIFPIEKYGVKIMSIGFFVEKNQSLIWRGLVLNSIPMKNITSLEKEEGTNWHWSLTHGYWDRSLW
jgi:ATP-binding protein involved in chromosome partitioning